LIGGVLGYVVTWGWEATLCSGEAGTARQCCPCATETQSDPTENILDELAYYTAHKGKCMKNIALGGSKCEGNNYGFKGFLPYNKQTVNSSAAVHRQAKK
jgi:hypothetical protein